MSDWHGFWLGAGIAVAGWFVMQGVDFIETGLSKIAEALKGKR